MQEKTMCYWVLYHECRFKEHRNTISKKDFRDEYCSFCLRGQLIEILFDFAHKFDKL